MTAHEPPAAPDTSAANVVRLLWAQFPQFADLALQPVAAAGTDHAIYRLGEDLVIRLPRTPDAARQADKDRTWLPRLAPQLPLQIPVVHGYGWPSEHFGWPYTIQSWIDGQDAGGARVADWVQVALELGQFVRRLRAVDPTGGPPPGPGNSYRGVALTTRDAHVRHAAEFTRATGADNEFTRGVDVDEVLRIWQEAVDAPLWSGPPTWFHGDLLPGNLLFADGRLKAVIDFGCMGVADPSCDVLPTWTMFRGDARRAFLETVDPDCATRTRARGWAAYVGITAMPYHLDTNPAFCALARGVLDELLAEG